MTTKEWNEHLIKKWDFMLQPLEQKKTSKSRYAKMFEQTTLHSNTSTIKLALPLLQKIIYSLPDVKASPSSKTSIFLGQFDKDFVIDGNSIMPDGASSFIDHMSKLAKEKVNEIQKINHIMLTTEGNQIKVYILY